MDKQQELNSLIVSHNRISQFLPRTIDRLPALTKISLYVSLRIRMSCSLSCCICHLTHKFACCAYSSHNLLEEIPDLSALTGLTELRLSHNKIKKIPFSLAKLSTFGM